MRHRLAGRKLGRKTGSRLALQKNLIRSLFIHERIRTTLPKAKEYRPRAEKLITLGKVDTVANRRRAFARLRDKVVVKKLFEELGPRYRDRPGGYTRILHLPRGRVGDNAPLALFELVAEGKPPEESGDAAAKRKKKRLRKKKKKKAAKKTEE